MYSKYYSSLALLANITGTQVAHVVIDVDIVLSAEFDVESYKVRPRVSV